MSQSLKSQSLPPGWGLETVFFFCLESEDVQRAELVLPQALHAYAKESLISAERRRLEFKAARASEVESADEHASEDAKALTSFGAQWPTRKKSPNDFDVAEERESLKLQYDGSFETREPMAVEVYAWDQPLKLLESTRTFDRELLSRNRKLYQELKEKGNRRPMAGPAPESLDRDLQLLKDAHPNFGEVVAFVKDQLALSKHREKPLRVPPLLLLGPPGVGKTHFASSLAGFLQSSIVRISFDTAHTASALLGSDRNWGNTSSGVVFEAVCQGEFANPVVVLDEADKCREGGHYQSPLASLHTLLEKLTAPKVTDISINFEFDASYVTWIATANDALAIAPSLRSRFVEFWIEAPTGEHALQMSKVMLQKTFAAMDISGFKEPGREFVRLIAHLTPREQRMALERAFATAVANDRAWLMRSDLPAEVLLDDQVLAGKQAAPGSGYLH